MSSRPDQALFAAPTAGPVGETSYWHPFGPMGRVRHDELLITRAQDVWIWDDADRRYLDATASLWYVNVGHGRREIVEAVTRQMSTLACYHTFYDFANVPALQLAERLAALAPVAQARILLGSGGGDAIDTAAKLARVYFQETGQPERVHLISRQHSYHGTHGFGTSLAGMTTNRLGGPFHPAVSVVPYDDAEALEAEIERLGPERVAAFFIEPVIGAGGVLPPPPGYVERVAEVCRRHGVLLVADAVICGFGRLGNWFGIERFGVTPDLIVFAKGVTSGYLPLGGVVVSGRVAEPFWERPDAPPFRHGQTYAGHPAACAAALANLDILEGDGLLDRALGLEGELFDALKGISDHPLVREVRGGVGVLAAVELDPERLAGDAKLPLRAFHAIRERGVIVRSLLSAFALSPPLTATSEHLDLMVEAISGGLDSLA